jgi:hypothetical protein
MIAYELVVEAGIGAAATVTAGAASALTAARLALIATKLRKLGRAGEKLADLCQPNGHLAKKLEQLFSQVKKGGKIEGGDAPNSTVLNALDNVRVPAKSGTATTLTQRLTDAEMAALQRTHGVEFAQIYITGQGKNGGGGTTLLIRGTEVGTTIPLGSNVRVINHTHPTTLNGKTVPLRPSTEDVDALKKLQSLGSPQKKSQIVTEGGQVIIFNNKGKVR